MMSLVRLQMHLLCHTLIIVVLFGQIVTILFWILCRFITIDLLTFSYQLMLELILTIWWIHSTGSIKLNKRWEKHFCLCYLNALLISLISVFSILILLISNLFIHIAQEAKPLNVFSFKLGTLFLKGELSIIGHVTFGTISLSICVMSYYLWACVHSTNIFLTLFNLWSFFTLDLINTV